MGSEEHKTIHNTIHQSSQEIVSPKLQRLINKKKKENRQEIGKDAEIREQRNDTDHDDDGNDDILLSSCQIPIPCINSNNEEQQQQQQINSNPSLPNVESEISQIKEICKKKSLDLDEHQKQLIKMKEIYQRLQGTFISSTTDVNNEDEEKMENYSHDVMENIEDNKVKVIGIAQENEQLKKQILLLEKIISNQKQLKEEEKNKKKLLQERNKLKKQIKKLQNQNQTVEIQEQIKNVNEINQQLNLLVLNQKNEIIKAQNSNKSFKQENIKQEDDYRFLHIKHKQEIEIQRKLLENLCSSLFSRIHDELLSIDSSFEKYKKKEEILRISQSLADHQSHDLLQLRTLQDQLQVLQHRNVQIKKEGKHQISKHLANVQHLLSGLQHDRSIDFSFSSEDEHQHLVQDENTQQQQQHQQHQQHKQHQHQQQRGNQRNAISCAPIFDFSHQFLNCNYVDLYQLLRTKQSELFDLQEDHEEMLEELRQQIQHEKSTMNDYHEKMQRLVDDLLIIEEELKGNRMDTTVMEIQCVSDQISQLRFSVEERRQEFLALRSKRKQMEQQLNRAETLKSKHKKRLRKQARKKKSKAQTNKIKLNALEFADPDNSPFMKRNPSIDIPSFVDDFDDDKIQLIPSSYSSNSTYNNNNNNNNININSPYNNSNPYNNDNKCKIKKNSSSLGSFDYSNHNDNDNEKTHSYSGYTNYNNYNNYSSSYSSTESQKPQRKQIAKKQEEPFFPINRNILTYSYNNNRDNHDEGTTSFVHFNDEEDGDGFNHNHNNHQNHRNYNNFNSTSAGVQAYSNENMEHDEDMRRSSGDSWTTVENSHFHHTGSQKKTSIPNTDASLQVSVSRFSALPVQPCDSSSNEEEEKQIVSLRSNPKPTKKQLPAKRKRNIDYTSYSSTILFGFFGSLIIFIAFVIFRMMS